MKEQAIVDFLNGDLAAEKLNRLAREAEWQRSANGDQTVAEPLDATFTLEPAHAAALCDQAADGRIFPRGLQVIVTLLLESTHFEWDSELIDRILRCICEPELNYTLNGDNLRRFSRWLRGTQKPPFE